MNRQLAVERGNKTLRAVEGIPAAELASALDPCLLSGPSHVHIARFARLRVKSSPFNCCIAQKSSLSVTTRRDPYRALGHDACRRASPSRLRLVMWTDVWISSLVLAPSLTASSTNAVLHWPSLFLCPSSAATLRPLFLTYLYLLPRLALGSSIFCLPGAYHLSASLVMRPAPQSAMNPTNR
jgi:hypothetical protein